MPPLSISHSWQSVPNSLIIRIQDGGGRHIEFRKVSTTVYSILIGAM